MNGIEVQPELDMIVDGNGVFARAYYALSSANAEQAQEVHSAFSVLDEDISEPLEQEVYRVVSSGILDLILGGPRECPLQHPDRLAVVWDGMCRRDKGRRKPASYYSCLDLTRARLSQDMDVTQYVAEGEADDAIASMAVKCERQGHQVLIVSSDKDLCQIITDRVQVYSPHQRQVLGATYVRERWGVLNPAHFALYLAVVGDAIDRIPGLKGYGPKAFAKLYTGIDKKATVSEAFAHIYGRLSEERGLELEAMLDLTLLDYGLVVPEPSPCRNHRSTAGSSTPRSWE